MATLTPPFALDRIDHVLILVHGMDRALPFYEGVLGAVVTGRMPQYGMVEMRAGESHLDLVDVADPKGSWARPVVDGGRNVDHVALRVSGCDAASVREHLAKNGVDIVEERPEAGALSLYVHDPSGVTIELVVPASRSAT